jgi:hypothetical protein
MQAPSFYPLAPRSYLTTLGFLILGSRLVSHSPNHIISSTIIVTLTTLYMDSECTYKHMGLEPCSLTLGAASVKRSVKDSLQTGGFLFPEARTHAEVICRCLHDILETTKRCQKGNSIGFVHRLDGCESIPELRQVVFGFMSLDLQRNTPVGRSFRGEATITRS